MKLDGLSPAKLNLALHVTGILPNKMHKLDSLVAFTKFGDRITVEQNPVYSLSTSGPFGQYIPSGDDNIVHAACTLFDKEMNTRIEIIKNIPPSCGLGGGSSNAAKVIRFLAQLWKIPLPPVHEAACIGADVPVCLYGEPSRVQGFGERLTPIKVFPDLAILLVNPLIQLSTSDVYNTLENPNNSPFEPLPVFDSQDVLVSWLSRQRNDLTSAAIKIYPDITRLLDAIHSCDGCKLSRMSGSGATCFGVFSSMDLAQNASEWIKSHNPSWWTKATNIVGISQNQ